MKLRQALFSLVFAPSFALAQTADPTSYVYDTTSTATNTNVNTSTATNTNTNVNTSTSEALNTNINTSTATNTNINTSTATNTNINTSTSNNYNENVSTSTSTSTNFNTNINQNTSTSTNTNYNYGDVTNRNISTNTNVNTENSTQNITTNANQTVNQTTTASNVNQNNNVNVSDSKSTSYSEVINRQVIDQNLKSPPPSAIAPSMMSYSQDLCTTGQSGAVQTQIFGLSAGKTVRDMNCERLKLSKTMFDMGMKVAAVSLLCQDERVFRAMEMAGTPCPFYGAIGAKATESWAENADQRPDKGKRK